MRMNPTLTYALVAIFITAVVVLVKEVSNG